ncbi:MAG: uracil-DNA glycosylase family protein [Candidatus Paceibacterota bacterium]|nr:MAG: uracil-DNA glycosylase family protein [Candidatus Paceibacterota bacterium]
MRQVTQLHKLYDSLQKKHGAPLLRPIYGAGCIDSPAAMFVFMNPTGRNISSHPDWGGLRAPWVGTRHVWDIFNELNLINTSLYDAIKLKQQWDVRFTNLVYKDIESKSIFITNLAKCTQLDARPLNNGVFRDYLDLMYQEIEMINPKKIITFGNQVSSVLLKKNISVSGYSGATCERLSVGGATYCVYPTHYPVGQGRRNMPLAIQRIREILR